MFGKLLTRLKSQHPHDHSITRRRYSRRDVDHCVCVMNGKTYPITNWSMGGVLVNADSRPFAVEDHHDITLKFKLSDKIIDVPQHARIVRKSHDRVAFEFSQITQHARDMFQSVVDDYVVNKFADTQNAYP